MKLSKIKMALSHVRNSFTICRVSTISIVCRACRVESNSYNIPRVIFTSMAKMPPSKKNEYTIIMFLILRWNKKETARIGVAKNIL